MIRPSSLPMFAQCPCFEGKGGEFADSGTKRHAYLESLCKNVKCDFLSEIPEEEIEAVDWAFDYIKCHAPTSNYPIHFERKMYLLNADFERVFPEGGTTDVVCGPEIFDLKWRERDYELQMAAYALMLMDECAYVSVSCHLLFAESRRKTVLNFTRESASELVFGVIAKANDPRRKPNPCDYCGWCANAYKCPPHLEAAKKVSAGYSDLDRVKNWHPSQMESAEEINRALWIWRNILSKWGDSIEHHALITAREKGLTLADYDLKQTSGGTYLTDIVGAFGVLGIPQDEFLKCCELHMSASKKYPDKKGAVETYAGLKGIKKTPAAKEVKAKLTEAGLLKDKKPKVFLKAKKSTIETNEGETKNADI